MKLWRSLGFRIVLTTLISTGLAASTIGLVAMDSVLTATANFVRSNVQTNDYDRLTECTLLPAHFEAHPTPELTLHAYDVQTGGSVNPSAPPLDLEVLRRLQNGESTAGRFYWDGSRGGIMLLRMAEQGPCSVMAYHWGFDLERRIPMVSGMFFVMGVVASLCSLLAWSVVIRPSEARLRALAQRAELIGASKIPPLALEPPRDTFDQIGVSLESAHRRILNHEVALANTQRTVLEHLENLAHDLRTPLASIQLLLDALQQPSASLGESERRYVRLAQEESIYLSALMDDLHMAVQLREGLDPLGAESHTELGRVLERLIPRMAHQGRQREVEVCAGYMPEPLFVHCNVLVLERVISNLIRNAILYGKPGGHVLVMAERLEGARFRLMVLDDGPGVAPEELPRLHERHFRGSNARKDKGSGLGLAIVGEVCHRIGWTLRFLGRDPSGLEVRLEGPLLAEGVAAAHSSLTA